MPGRVGTRPRPASTRRLRGHDAGAHAGTAACLRSQTIADLAVMEQKPFRLQSGSSDFAVQ